MMNIVTSDGKEPDTDLVRLHEAATEFGSTLPVGTIYHCAPVYSYDLRDADGVRLVVPLTKLTWRQLYFELYQSTIGTQTLPALDEVDARADTHRGHGVVPIALAHLRYRTPREVFAAYADAKLREVPFPLPDGLESMVREETAFFASAFLPDRFAEFARLDDLHYGLHVNFSLSSDLLISNMGIAPEDVEIDFGDGAGFRKVALDETIAVVYPEEGDHRVTLRARIGAEMRTSFFEVALKQALVLPPYEKWERITSATPFNGVTATGHAWVFLGAGNTSITDPVILSEGFPGNYSLEDLWSLLDQKNLASALLVAGKDLIIIGYDKPYGTSYIEATAEVVIACIRKVIASRKSDRKLTVGGASMGGLITRFALALLETRRDPASAEVDTFVSIDSPHEGSSVPLSVLAFADYFSDFVSPVKDIKTQLDSLAAQEMLLFWYNSKTNTFENPSDLRTKFLKNLKDVGSFPTLARKFGLADGSGDGSGNSTPSGERTLSWQNGVSSCTLISSPGRLRGTKGRYICSARWATNLEKFYNAPDNMVNIDSAPGGTRAFFKEIYDQNSFGATLDYADACFIPTISALAMGELIPYKNDDLFRDVARSAPYSALGGIRWSQQNREHVELTLNGALWLAELLDVRALLVDWGRPGSYDGKAWIPAVALEPYSDRVVSVHEGPSEHALYYRMGFLNKDNTIIWDKVSRRYDAGGNRPTISINSSGTIIEVHKTSRDGDETLYYYRGTVDQVTWNRVNFPAHSQHVRDSSNQQVYGTRTRVALQGDVAVLVWEQKGEIWYMLGQLSSDPKLIDWLSPQRLSTGNDRSIAKIEAPSVTITADLDAIIAFGAKTKSNQNTLRYKIGKISYDRSKITNPALDWITTEDVIYEWNGITPSIAIDLQGGLIAVHVVPSNRTLRYRIGSLGGLPAGSSGPVGWGGAQWPVVTINQRGLVVTAYQAEIAFVVDGPAIAIGGTAAVKIR